ncbi:hypothetical protein FSC37_11315 [Piscinibacter aquaticus]|uniref:Uncharacterized protein n=1 Tax=Piscinibacter aquaticus TaxID=392597 RepID=A0A5C6TZW5_9BURK|nr:hypothetical protein FSC37_11315 [Piscinibacter aquaticus]
MPFGTFSCEQAGQPLVWSQRQCRCCAVGSRASLALLHAATAMPDTQPAALWEPSSPNRLLTMPAPLESDDDPADRRDRS